MESEPQNLVTLGDLVRLTGKSKHVLNYALESYRIEPVQRAGIIRLWSRDQIPHIKSALARISGRREVSVA